MYSSTIFVGTFAFVTLSTTEWRIPDEILPEKWLFEVVGGFSPLIRCIFSLSEKSNSDWLKSFIADVIHPSYTIPEKPLKLGSSSRCSFVYSNRRQCFTKLGNFSDCGTSNPPQFCIEFWRKKYRKGIEEICSFEKRKVNCENLRNSIVDEVIYNESHAHYSLKHAPQAMGFTYQKLMKGDPEDELASFLPIVSHTTFFVVLFDTRINAYGEDICTLNNCTNKLFQQFTKQSKICVFHRCVPLISDNEYGRNCPNTVELIFRASSKLDYKNVTNALLRRADSPAETCPKISKLTISMETLTKQVITPRFYSQRGRFHCPSEVSCLWDMFYSDNNNENENTNTSAVLMKIATIVAFYILSSTKVSLI